MNILQMNRVPQSVWINPIHFIACGFGVGAIPIMPGTFGTVLGVLFYLMMSRLPLFIYFAITVLFFLAGVVMTGITNRDFGTHDHSAAVWDEVVGFLVVMIGIPQQWIFILLGFIFFRIFDIWKPWPIRWIEKKLPNGFGVMADDVVAAFYAWILLWLAMRLHILTATHG